MQAYIYGTEGERERCARRVSELFLLSVYAVIEYGAGSMQCHESEIGDMGADQQMEERARLINTRLGAVCVHASTISAECWRA